MRRTMNTLKGLRFALITAALATALAAGWLPAADIAAQSLTGDAVPTKEGGDLIIRPMYHGTFVMTWNHRTIYVDPTAAPGQDRNKSAAAGFKDHPIPDLILVTDVHGDHLSIPTLMDLAGPFRPYPKVVTIVAPQAAVVLLPSNPLRGITRRLSHGRTITVHGIQIEAIPMYNLTKDRLQYHARDRGNGYILTMGGTRVYIAGDTEDIPEMRALENIDVAFVPMNLPYTMTPEQAADAVREFKPRIVYPYHYGQSDLSAFTRLVGKDAGVEVRVRDWYPKE
jgi:L-ascorbate metabolism protein UlaG (beta-lactamase superfamily)